MQSLTTIIQEDFSLDPILAPGKLILAKEETCFVYEYKHPKEEQSGLDERQALRSAFIRYSLVTRRTLETPLILAYEDSDPGCKIVVKVIPDNAPLALEFLTKDRAKWKEQIVNLYEAKKEESSSTN